MVCVFEVMIFFLFYYIQNKKIREEVEKMSPWNRDYDESGKKCHTGTMKKRIMCMCHGFYYDLTE